MDLLLSLFPIVLLIYLMTRKNAVPSYRALPIVAVILYFLKLAYFGADPNRVNAGVVDGLLTAFVPISIILGAIFMFKTMEYSGAMEVIRRWLNGITENKVAQAMIVAWAFAFLIEGASGFGTPAAIAAPILVGMGFPAVRVAILALIMNSVPVHFGAVGTPGWFGLGQLPGIEGPQLLEIGFKAALMHSAAALVVPVIALAFALSLQEVRRNLLFVYLSILSCIVPYVIAARFNDEFPSVVAGGVGLVISVFLARHGIGLAKQSGEREKAERVALPVLLKASFPLWGTVVVLLVTRIKQLGIKPLLTDRTEWLSFSLGTLGDFQISRALVLSLENIFGTGMNFNYALLYIPALIPFFLVSGLAFLLFRSNRQVINRTFSESLSQMKKPVIALLAALVFVKLLMLGTSDAPANSQIIGNALAKMVGPYWQFFASYLGALGSFFSGSNTVSNLTFGGIQLSIAKQLGLDVETILAMQSVGGGMGNMVCINNIVAVCSVLSLSHKEGFILKRTVMPMLIYGVIAALVGSFLM